MIAIYARVSTEEQARSGFSLTDQLRECRNKAGTNEVAEYVDEGISGEFLDRPQLARLRQDIRSGIIHKVICLDPDRLSRKLMHQLLITDEWDRHGVELQFVNGEYAKTPEGTLFYSMRGAIAEFEKAKINERMSRGRREKARQGRVLRDFHMYGYDYDKETEQLTVNEQEAQVIRLVFRLFTQPDRDVQGMNGIARYLTEAGIPTKRGAKVWHRQVVRQMLANRAYIGEFFQNRWNTEGVLANKHKPPGERQPARPRPIEEWISLPCPAIVDRQLFEHAQQLLQMSRRRWSGTQTNRYLLSGLVRCGLCGQTMTGRQAKHWGKQVRFYTDRKQPAGTKTTGCGQKINGFLLEEAVWNRVKEWICDAEAIAAAAALRETEYGQEELSVLEKELEKTKEGTRRLLALYAEGAEWVEEELHQALRERKEKEEKLSFRISEYRRQQRSYEHQLSMEEIIPCCLADAEEELSTDEKRELIRCLVQEIRVYPDRVEIGSF
ncbi:recombinase family protein [Brevibacillus sp. H7]|uniref:recombinase family protein n=1 Tax=Brevibacillus sp. H7 TaxID=3349138 RepID=UPI0037F5CCF4